MSRASAVKDWVDTLTMEDIPPMVDDLHLPTTVRESSRALASGVDAIELDTIPAEFLELFK